MKKTLGWILMLLCLLTACCAVAEEACTHAQTEEKHIDGAAYLVCTACGEQLRFLSYCDAEDDADQDGYCDVCGCDVRFRVYGGTYYPSMEKAADAMRKLIIRREYGCVFFEVTEADYHASDLTDRFTAMLLRYTGVFNEGDYLEDSLIMLGFQAEYVIYGGRYFVGYANHQYPVATTAEQEAALYAAIDSLISSNGWRNLEGYEQIKAVYDWVCANVAYDHAHMDVCDPFYHLRDLATPIQPDFIPHQAYAALMDRKAVCSGYAQLLYAIYNKLGVHCRNVSGYGNNESHMWNLVELDGAYYYIDATWDAERLREGQEYAFFLRAKANMTGHVVDDADVSGYDMSKLDYGVSLDDPDAILESGTMDGVEWVLTGDGTLTFSGEGVILHNPVTDKSLVLKIVLGEGITEIGTVDWDSWFHNTSYAVFEGCSNLETVELGSGVTLIGDATFRWCESLKAIVFPSQVKEIGYGVFRGCEKLQSASFPAGITVLRNSLFCGCYQLSQVNVPASVKTIEDSVFDYCTSLEAVTLPAGLETLGTSVFYECTALKTIEIPAGVKVLDLQVFFNCTGLTSVTLHEGLEEVGECVFDGCTSLAVIDLPSTVTRLGTYCLSETPITTITLPSGITEIPDDCFTGCRNLTSVVVPSGVTRIGRYAFSDCDALTTVQLPEGLKVIDSHAFLNCDVLTTLTLPASVETLGEYCFADSPFETMVLPEKLTEIPNSLFNGCKQLTSVTIPDGVSRIGDYAFYRCTALPEVSLPEGVTEIGEYAFSRCSALERINLPDGIETLGAYCFHACAFTRAVLPSSLTAIPDHLFWYCPALTYVYIPDGVSCIGEAAFQGCYALTEIRMADSVTQISAGAFRGCEELTGFRFPASLTAIPAYCLLGCHKLESIIIPAGVRSIDMYGVGQCNALRSIVFLGDAPSMASDAFAYVTATVTYPSGNDTWTADVMQNYTGTLTWVAHEHAYTETIQPPTCTEDGCTVYACACGDTYTDAVVPATGHAIAAQQATYEATEGDALTIVYTCLCGHVADESVSWAAEDAAMLALNGIVVDAEAGTATVTYGARAVGVTTVKVGGCTVVVHSDEPAVLPERATVIEPEAFRATAVEEVRLPASMTTISDAAFADCAALALVYMPDSVITIGDGAFSGCPQVAFLCESDNAAAAYAEGEGIPCIILP